MLLKKLCPFHPNKFSDQNVKFTRQYTDIKGRMGLKEGVTTILALRREWDYDRMDYEKMGRGEDVFEGGEVMHLCHPPRGGCGTMMGWDGQNKSRRGWVWWRWSDASTEGASSSFPKSRVSHYNGWDGGKMSWGEDGFEGGEVRLVRHWIFIILQE